MSNTNNAQEQGKLTKSTVSKDLKDVGDLLNTVLIKLIHLSNYASALQATIASSVEMTKIEEAPAEGGGAPEPKGGDASPA
jgi:hypothetical protein